MVAAPVVEDLPHCALGSWVAGAEPLASVSSCVGGGGEVGDNRESDKQPRSRRGCDASAPCPAGAQVTVMGPSTHTRQWDPKEKPDSRTRSMGAAARAGPGDGEAVTTSAVRCVRSEDLVTVVGDTMLCQWNWLRENLHVLTRTRQTREELGLSVASCIPFTCLPASDHHVHPQCLTVCQPSLELRTL